MKETMSLDKEDETLECKVKLEVLANAQRRMQENPEIESPMDVG